MITATCNLKNSFLNVVALINPVFADGGRVKELQRTYPEFFKERRNLLLGVCIDAFNPFNSGTYSLTPIVLVVYNLSPEVSPEIECLEQVAMPMG